VNKTEDGGLDSLDERLREGPVSGKPILLFEKSPGPFRSHLMGSAVGGLGTDGFVRRSDDQILLAQIGS
jgi:hypothetical protein